MDWYVYRHDRLVQLLENFIVDAEDTTHVNVTAAVLVVSALLFILNVHHIVAYCQIYLQVL